jgi:hypothetical protein
MALCSMIFGHGRTSHPREILFESIIHTFIVLGYIHQVQVKFSSLTSLRFLTTVLILNGAGIISNGYSVL